MTPGTPLFASRRIRSPADRRPSRRLPAPTGQLPAPRPRSSPAPQLLPHRPSHQESIPLPPSSSRGRFRKANEPLAVCAWPRQPERSPACSIVDIRLSVAPSRTSATPDIGETRGSPAVFHKLWTFLFEIMLVSRETRTNTEGPAPFLVPSRPAGSQLSPVPDRARRTSIMRFWRSAGETPGIRPAWAKVGGRTRASFWRASVDSVTKSR